MSRAGAETRARVVESAKERMRRHGVAATSMLDAIADADASRGSLYHYFPGGKSQLIEEATTTACAEYGAAFALIENLDATEAVPAMVDYWRAQVESTDFSAGCPVAAAALSGDETASARAAAGVGFSTWTSSIEKMLLTSGVPTSRTRSLASLILSAVEGAVVVSLAQRSLEPMEVVGQEVLRIVDSARAQPTPPGGTFLAQ